MLFQITSMWQIIGWVLVFAGLILSNMSEKNRRDFEFELNQAADEFKRKMER